MSFLVSLLLLLHCFTSAGQKKPEEGGKQSFNNAPHSGQYNSNDNRRHREGYRLVLLQYKVRKRDNALTMLHTVDNTVAMTKGDTGRDTD